MPKIVIYTTKDGHIQLNVKLVEETVWLTQKQMADLFDKNINFKFESICGEYKMRPNHHLNKTFFILYFAQNSDTLKIQDDNIVTIYPTPFLAAGDKIINCDANENKLSIADRVYV